MNSAKTLDTSATSGCAHGAAPREQSCGLRYTSSRATNLMAVYSVAMSDAGFLV